MLKYVIATLAVFAAANSFAATTTTAPGAEKEHGKQEGHKEAGKGHKDAGKGHKEAGKGHKEGHAEPGAVEPVKKDK